MAKSAVVHKLAGTITAHAWNADRSRVVICPNNNEAWIYANASSDDTSKWVVEHVLKAHDFVITSMDWCPVSNRIVTCSQDRNAFVWTFDSTSGEWQQQLVLLRINRAATHCRWAPDGAKFAVASGAKTVSVCGYEAVNNWWFAAQIAKFKSTVNCVVWHPNSKMVAAAACDYHCRVAAAWLDDVGDTPDVGAFGSPDGLDFGDFILDLSLDDDPVPSTWVNGAAWSPAGTQLAYISQASQLFVVSIESGTVTKDSVRHRGLPFLSCIFLDENTIVAAGFDMNPAVFRRSGGTWAFDTFADAPKKPDAGAGPGAAAASSSSSFSSARALFDAKVSTGRAVSAAAADKLETKHEGAIVEVRALPDAAGSPAASKGGLRFSTVGSDGRLVVWTL